MLVFNTLFYNSSHKKPKLASCDESVDKSVDKTDPGECDAQFDPTDQDLEHHKEQNRRELPRLGINSNIQS